MAEIEVAAWGASMRAVIALAALCLSGCGEMQLSCSPTDHVRASVNGREFTIPVSLKPSFFGDAAEHARLPSHTHRDDQGHWAYCQGAHEKPLVAETFSFYPRKDLPEAYFIIVGRERRFERRKPDQWPVHNDAGFEVTVTKGPVIIFSPAGGVRPTAVEGNCTPSLPRAYQYCRVDFTTLSGVALTVDIVGEQPLTEWPTILARVDAYVRRLET